MRNAKRKASYSHELATMVALLMFSSTIIPCMRIGHAQTLAESSWLYNPVTLDGAITSPNEWAESHAYSMSLDRRWGWPDPQVEPSNKSLSARFKNDEVWLYMLYQVPWPVAEADNTRDWGFILQRGSDSGWVKFQTTFDGYGFNGTEWSSDVEAGGQNNVEGAVSYDNMSYWFEFRKMLDSGDGLDWSLAPGESVDGLRVGVLDDSIQSIYTQDVTLQLALTVSMNITVGVDVTVYPTSDLELTFSNVTAEGYLTADKTSTVEAPPLVNLTGQYYEISVTASYSGSVTISLAYDDLDMQLDRESSLQMVQYTPLLGDVYDYGRVNIMDISFVAKSFGAPTDDPRWNASADIDQNGKIDILDLAKCAKNFFKTAEWTNITTYVDTELDIVHGETTHFSFIGIH